MSRITITEQNLTGSSITGKETDIVYVPGFSVATMSTKILPDDEYDAGNGGLGVPDHIPMLCSSLSDFERYFGSEPPAFATAQNYLAQTGGTGEGFPPESIPGYDQDTEQTANSVVWFEANDVDPSYIYAKELITQGIPVMYERINKLLPSDDNTDMTVANMYSELQNTIYPNNPTDSKLSDKGEYSIKFLTSGGYPVFEFSDNRITKNMISLAGGVGTTASTYEGRGDCVALIDHTDNPDRDLSGSKSVFKQIQELTGNLDYAAMFTPWGQFSLTNYYNFDDDNGYNLPGSFAYLSCLAKSIQTYPNWFAVAGVSRGLVPNLIAPHLNSKLSNSIAELYQPDGGISINAVTNIKPYGQCIWGNRTLVKNDENRTLSATAFLNTRNMVSDIKKQLYVAAKSLMFEQNTDVLWINFKSLVTPLLDQLLSGQGISGYKILKQETSQKEKLSAVVRIYPIYAVESFDIVVELSDEELTVE